MSFIFLFHRDVIGPSGLYRVLIDILAQDAGDCLVQLLSEFFALCQAFKASLDMNQVAHVPCKFLCSCRQPMSPSNDNACDALISKCASSIVKVADWAIVKRGSVFQALRKDACCNNAKSTFVNSLQVMLTAPLC